MFDVWAVSAVFQSFNGELTKNLRIYQTNKHEDKYKYKYKDIPGFALIDWFSLIS